MKSKLKESIAVVPAEQVTVIDKEYAQKLLVRFFVALDNATGDTVNTVLVIEKITESIEADPELSKQVLTPENIGHILDLKRKADSGKIKLEDVEKAFPSIEKKVPMWGMLKTFF